MQSKPGSFSAYLEYAQRDRNERNVPSPAASPLSLLRLIIDADPEKGVPLAELAERSGLSASTFREALAKLRDQGFLTVEGPTLEERVKCTAKGAEVAKLA